MSLLLGPAATGCTAGPARPGAGPEGSAATGGGSPAAESIAQPVGVKWNGYSYPADLFAPVISAYRGGGSFHDITWCAIERERGVLRWAAEDRVVDDILRYGLEPLIRIHVGTCWASGRAPSATPRNSPSFPPADPDAYRAFVRTLVERYAAKGVHRYAIENEIDAENYWGDDPSTYPVVARAGAAAVRETDPKAVLVDPGLSSSSYGLAVVHALDTGANGHGNSAGSAAARRDEAVRFYRAFYARRGQSRLPRADDLAALRGAYRSAAGRRILAAHAAVTEIDRAGVFDVYQLHYYDPWQLAATVLDHIRQRVGARMPIEAWEAGSFWPGDSYDAARHAEETAKLTATLLAGGVRRIVYLPLFHSPGVIAPEERWRGLYTRDGTARPAAAALDRLRDAAHSGRWRPIGGPAARGLAGAVVDHGATTTLVLWSADGTRRALRRPAFAGAAGAVVTPLPAGTARPWHGGDLPISDAPLIISARAQMRTVLRWLQEETT